MEDNLEKIEQSGSAVVNLGGRPFRIRKEFVEDVRNQDVANRLRNLKRALLVLHAPLDKTVDVHNAQEIFAAALHPKSFISLDKADHLLSNPEDSEYAGLIIANWARRYLDPAEADNAHAKEPEQTAVDDVDGVIVTGRSSDGFACKVQSGNHQWVADEPPGIGTDTGPDPLRAFIVRHWRAAPS